MPDNVKMTAGTAIALLGIVAACVTGFTINKSDIGHLGIGQKDLQKDVTALQKSDHEKDLAIQRTAMQVEMIMKGIDKLSGFMESIEYDNARANKKVD